MLFNISQNNVMFPKATYPVEKACWLAKDIASDCSVTLIIYYNLHNSQSTKNMFSVFLYLETEMERPSKGKSNGGRITTYQKR